MVERSLRILVSALGLAFVAGCGGEQGTGQGAEATVTATATVTTKPPATPPAERPPLSPIKVLTDLVEREYPPPTLEDIGHAICDEVRTGDRNASFPWREMIGYIGERRVGAFIAYSVAAYCPEDGQRLVGLMGGSLSQQ